MKRSYNLWVCRNLNIIFRDKQLTYDGRVKFKKIWINISNPITAIEKSYSASSGVTRGGGGERGIPSPKNFFFPSPKNFFPSDILFCYNFQSPQPENQETTVEWVLKIYFYIKIFKIFWSFYPNYPKYPTTPNYTPLIIDKNLCIYYLYSNENISFIILISRSLSHGKSSNRKEDKLEFPVCIRKCKYKTLR